MLFRSISDSKYFRLICLSTLSTFLFPNISRDISYQNLFILESSKPFIITLILSRSLTIFINCSSDSAVLLTSSSFKASINSRLSSVSAVNRVTCSLNLKSNSVSSVSNLFILPLTLSSLSPYSLKYKSND